MNTAYAKQAALVIKVIPHIATEDAFALKGGTDINLFEHDLPRLSADIDLTYTVISPRDVAIREINGALDKNHLLTFTSLQCSTADFGIPRLDMLPGIIWKQRNLQMLKTSNQAKFSAQVKQIANLLNC